MDGLSGARTVPPRASRSGRAVAGIALLMLIVAAALVGWLVWTDRIDLGQTRTTTAAPTALPAPATTPTLAQPPATSLEAQQGALEQRLAAMEQRLARIDLQAEAASGNAARAEGLLIAFATRRMIERGAPLGFLEDQLKLRFADAQPNAVETIVAFANEPVTLDRLTGELAALAPRIAEPPAEMLGWDRIRHELAGLFVIRREEALSPSPAARLERAQLSLRQGRIEEAIAQVEATPGVGQARQWLSDARRYLAVQRALDLIETTALLEPRRLQDGAGRPVEQPSPADAPLDPQPDI